jgi:hypothetical protein
MAKPHRYPPASPLSLILVAIAVASEVTLILVLVAAGNTPGQVALLSAVLGFVPLLLLAIAYVVQ